jgi:hypothetical protein
MAKNYRDVDYFETRPDIVKIFDDLEKFKDFCRFELCEFNEANLYNRESQIWNNFYHANRPKRPWTGDRKPRAEYNRSGGNGGGNYNRSYQR